MKLEIENPSDDLIAMAVKRQKELGFSTMSDYLTHLVLVETNLIKSVRPTLVKGIPIKVDDVQATWGDKVNSKSMQGMFLTNRPYGAEEIYDKINNTLSLHLPPYENLPIGVRRGVGRMIAQNPIIRGVFTATLDTKNDPGRKNVYVFNTSEAA